MEQSWHSLWQRVDHAHEPDGHLEYSEVAAFSGVILPHSGQMFFIFINLSVADWIRVFFPDFLLIPFSSTLNYHSLEISAFHN
jgi:hypothetical protein